MKSRLHCSLLAALSLALLVPAVGFAASLASDKASDPAYSGGWTNGSNGGVGWGNDLGWGTGWFLFMNGIQSNSPTTHFISSSTANNSSGDTNADGDINTAGVAWGMLGNGQEVDAARFLNSPLVNGQKFVIEMDNGTIVPGGQEVGFLLQSIDGETRLEFLLKTNSVTYEIVGLNSINTGITNTDQGLRIVFEQVNSDTGHVFITKLVNGSTFVFSNVALNTAVITHDIAAFSLINKSAGGAATNKLFFNSISILPNPADATLFADLSVTKSASQNPAIAGSNLTYTVTAKNNGPAQATAVTVTDVPPSGVTFVSATSSQGTCSTNGSGQLICNLGLLASNATASITLVVTPLAPGVITNIASVSALNVDPNPTNNLATNIVSVVVNNLPVLVVTPASRSFGTLAVGGISTQSFSVINSGTGTLIGTSTVSGISFVLLSGSPFAVSGGQTSTVALMFSPMSVGSFTGSVVFASNGGASTNAVTGTATNMFGGAPVAGFSGSPTNGAAPLVVSFTDVSTGTITGRWWTFGDGGISSATSVSHTYTNAGTFTVNLTVFGPLGSNTLTRSDYIIATNATASPSGSWQPASPLTTAREFHTATLLPNGKVLITGGVGSNYNAFASADLYDPATGIWTATGPLTTARYSHTATLLPNGKVMVAGGRGALGPLSSAELYDPATGIWTATGPLTTVLSGHTATLLPNGKVLVAGGYIPGIGFLSSSQLYDPASGTWTSTGSLSTARSVHTATLLPNGKVLITGGVGSNYTALSSAELYDPATGTWTSTGSLNTACSQHTATVLPNGKVLVAGDGDGNAELYDPATGTWTVTGALSSASGYHTATLLPNGKVLIAGGWGSSGYLSSAELYDPVTGTWTAIGPMTTAREIHTATLLPNGKVLVAGGFNGTELSSAELYDLASGTWTATGPLNTARTYTRMTLLPNGKVLVAGGYNNGSPLSSVELFDPASGTWTATAALTAARYYHTVTLLPNGKVLVAGGLGSSGILSSTELYDPATGTWTVTGALTFARNSHTATLLPNGKVLVAGGLGSSGILSSAELFDPATGTWAATGSLTTARWGHTAALLPNGKVLIEGGEGLGFSILSAELYDPATGTWTVTGSRTAARIKYTATLLPTGKVLVAGGWDNNISLSSAELYDPTTGTWTATGPLNAARNSHTATLLPNGKVLVAGGRDSSNNPLLSAELYDPASGTWTVTGPLNTPRDSHTGALLPNGKVLVAGGWNYNPGNYTTSAELYDVGLGFNASWQPQIAAFTSPLGLGGSLVLTGSQFRGISEGSGGNTQDSPADYPVVQLRSVESGQTLFLLPTNWSTNSFTSAPVTGFPPGYALVTMFVNGIPSTASILNIVPAVAPLPPSTITCVAADLQDRLGNLMPIDRVAVLVADTGTNGFVDPQPSFPLSLGATWGTDDKVVGLWDLRNGGDGILYDQTVVTYTNGVAPGQQLQLYWFPSLTLASNTVGFTYYGKYTDTNSPPLDYSAAWQLPASGSAVELWFLTQNEGGSNPQTAGRAILSTSPMAGFTASPTNGIVPLTVTFTNTSTGPITNQFWQFGDGGTSSLVNPSHTYTTGGKFSVTLTVSGLYGTDTLVASNLITVSPPPVPYVQAVANASPVAYWRLNETNGATVAVDFLGFHNGTISASVTPGVSGPRNAPFLGFETNNTAMQFNYTTGSYLTMPALNLNTNRVTICGWIKPTGSQAGWAGIAFCRGGSTVAGLHFGSGSIQNELRYTWNNSRWDKSTGLAVPTGQWSFVALVVTPTNGTIYMGTNGVLNSFTDVASEPSQAFDASLLIGYDPSEGSRLFRGVIDEVAVYNHSLTPMQIQELYNSAFSTPPPPLTRFQMWQFWYFGCTNCPEAAATADPDGDSQNNLTECLAGTDPTDSASAFRITSVVQEGNNIRVTWNAGGGTTNVLQATVGDEYGGYTNAFVDLNEPIIIPGTGDATTNSVDTGGATNCPARYYRVRLVP